MLIGYVGKSKLMKQIVLKRRFLEISYINVYREDGPNDRDAKNIGENCIKYNYFKVYRFYQYKCIVADKMRENWEEIQHGCYHQLYSNMPSKGYM